MSEFPFDDFKETDFKEFERFFKTNTVNPIYDHRANFQTNSPSFYEYLAKHNHLIKILAKRIYDYDKELAKRFLEWDKRIEHLPKELEELLIEWVNNGTLSEIINKELMYKKVDKIDHNEDIERLDERIDNVTVYNTGVSKTEILTDVFNTIDKKILSSLENKIKDGNFKSDNYRDNFFSLFSNGQITENNTAILTSVQSHEIIGGTLLQKLKDEFPTDEKWYIVSKVKSINTGIRDIVVGFRGIRGETVTGTGEYDDIRVNHYYKISHIYDPEKDPTSQDNYEGEFRATVSTRYPKGSDHVGKGIEVEYIMAFNLTEIFGYGKEPSKEVMDFILENIPETYFEGNLDSGKASTLNLRLILELFNTFSENTETKFKNIIYNPTFDRTINMFGWKHNNSERNTENDTFKMIGLGNSTLVRLTQETQLDYKANDKIYISGEFTPKNTAAISGGFAVHGIDDNGYANGLLNSEFDFDNLESVRLSDVFTLSENGTRKLNIQYRVKYPTEQDSENNEVQFRKPLVLNLTNIYGKGNEPNKTDIDLIIDNIPDQWFESNSNINDLVISQLIYSKNLKDDILNMDKSDLKNEILNPTFIRVSDFKWTHDGSARNTYDNVFTIKSIGVNSLNRLFQKTDVKIKPNKKVYVRGTFNAKNTDVTQVGLTIYGSENTGNIQYVTENNIPLNENVTLSGITTFDETQTGNAMYQVRVRYPSNEIGKDKEVDFKDPLILDLSETFGYGNEPSLEMMNEFFDTYEGNYFEDYASQKKLDDAHFKMFMSGKFSSGGNTQPLMVITIDDGFENDYTVLYPEFKKRNIGATSFIVPDWIDNRIGFLNLDQINEMKDLWDFQCHTLEHPRLAEQMNTEIHRQFQGVDDWFEQNGLEKPEHHAYPYGSHNNEVIEIGKNYRKSLRKIGQHSSLYNTPSNMDWYSVNAKSIDDLTDEQIEVRKEELKEVIRNGGLHVVVTHKIMEEPNGTYQTKLSHLLDIVDTFTRWGGKVVTMSQAYEILDIWK